MLCLMNSDTNLIKNGVNAFWRTKWVKVQSDTRLSTSTWPEPAVQLLEFSIHIVASAPLCDKHPHSRLTSCLLPSWLHSQSALSPDAGDRAHQHTAFVSELMWCYSVRVEGLNTTVCWGSLAHIMFYNTKGAPAQSFVTDCMCFGFVWVGLYSQMCVCVCVCVFESGWHCEADMTDTNYLTSVLHNSRL